MDIGSLVDAHRVLTLGPVSKAGALERMVASLTATVPGLPFGVVYSAVCAREREVSTRVASSLAMPHARLAGLTGCHVVLARCRVGIDYEDDGDEPVRLLAMVVGPLDEPDLFLSVLAELARVLASPAIRERAITADEPAEVLRLLLQAPATPERGGDPVSDALLRAAAATAEQLDARAVVVHLDAFPGSPALWRLPRDRRLVLAGRRMSAPPELDHPDLHFVKVPMGPGADRQVRVLLLFCLSRGLLGPEDVVVCVTGPSQGGGGDALVVTRVDRECGVAASLGAPGADVRTEVLERIVELACELASEGREGRPVGTVFAVGDAERVLQLSRQLVMNPFHGHPEESRNVLDPTLGETIKEFATIDGGFVVRGDGVVLSAGTYLRATDASVELAGGLGTRHHAAAAMSAATDAFCVAISASTGTVTLFKGGATLAVLERGVRPTTASSSEVVTSRSGSHHGSVRTA